MFEIYVSGCTKNCPGCHNPELHSFKKGELYLHKFKEIEKKLKMYPFKYLAIFGGDLFEYSFDEIIEFLHEMSEILIYTNTFQTTKIMVFTGETPETMKENFTLQELADIYDFCDFIKFGKYDETKKQKWYEQYDIKLASRNQFILTQKEIFDDLIKEE